MGDWLRAADSQVSVYSPDIFPQGSLRLDTTVRPLSHTEFDLDVVCLVNISDKVSPLAVYDLLLSRMKENGTYTKMIIELPRCIRLDYAGKFHLDIVPAVPDPACPPNETWIKIPDRELKIWRESNPRGYSWWFEQQAKKRKQFTKAARFSENSRLEPFRDPLPAISKPPLKLAVQILKRWRDICFKGREDLAPSSIILTTLAAQLYDGDDHPTEALLTILNGIYNLACDGPIRLLNPSNSRETITDQWVKKPERYQAFLNEIIDFRVRWQKLVLNGRFPQMVDELKDLFDEAPVKKAFTQFGERRTEARTAGNLLTEKRTGTLSIRTSTSAVAASELQVREHTFHGHE